MAQEQKIHDGEPMQAYRQSMEQNGGFQSLLGTDFDALVENLNNIKRDEIDIPKYADEFPLDIGSRAEGRSFLKPIDLYEAVLCSAFAVTKNIKANHEELKVFFAKFNPLA